MRELVCALLNLPWSIAMLLFALLCGPRRVTFHPKPFALIIHVRSFWVVNWRGSHRGVRAMAQGNVVVEGPATLPNDREHELIHVQQCAQRPFVQPFLYFLEEVRHGRGPQNKYEHEAYTKSNSTYLEE